MEKLLWLPVLKLLPVRYKEFYKEGRKVTAEAAAAAVALSLVPSSR